MAAYRDIYQFSFDDINGDDVDIFISKKNYAGVAQQRSLGRAPILKRERNGNILGTSLEIFAECKVDGEFSQLYTSSADEFRVEVYKRQTLLWRGFVSPELYSEPDIAPPYDVQIIATDGLGELKDALFSQNLLSLHNHLDNILEHTGLVLPIGIVSSLSWDDQQVNHSPYTLLTDTGIDLSNRIDDSCYDVLQDILRSLNACITQQDGGWLVIRESDLYDNVDKLSPVSFGSVNNAEWWPIGNLSSEIIPAKKRLTFVQDNKYRENLLTPIYTGVAGGWDLTSGVYYDNIEKGYIIPSSSDSISYAIDFRSYPLQTQLRLTLRARSISRDEIREEASKMSLAIMMTGRINGTSGVYHLTPDFLSDNDRTQMKWFGGDKLGFIRSWDAPRASEGEPAIQDIEVIIPLYNNGVNKYAAADQLTIEISNAPNSPYRLCIYDAILEADQQYPGVKVVADIANDAREEASEINVAMATSPDPMLEATMYGQLHGDGGIIGIYTPASSASDLLSFLVRDYAMQVALPRMRYRGKLNVPSLAFPRIPMLFERDNTYYFLNTYSYDLLNSELEVELISIPNASVSIESETVTELPSAESSGSSSSGSSGGGGTSGGGGSSTLAGLADVQVGNAQNGQALVYENGYWVPRTVSGGGSLSADAIIAALGYTPFDSAAFTKSNIKNALGIADWALAAKKPSYTWTDIGSRPTALSAFTNDLGLGSLAYKSSLVASDIPSLPWSKITSGKPTTLSGYGITDGLVYSAYINLDSAYRHIGYGYTSIGWKTAGPAAVFGTALYNLRMQCAIGTTDTPYVYVSQMYNGEAKGWAELVTYEGAAGKDFEALRYKIGETYVLNRSGNDTFLNYGNRTTGILQLYGTSLYFTLNGSSIPFKILDDGKVHIAEVPLTRGPSGSLKAGAYEAFQYFSDEKLIMHRNVGATGTYINYGGRTEGLTLYGSALSFNIGDTGAALILSANKDASFAANLTVAGNMYSKNYPAGKALLQDPTSAFISTIFDADAVGSSGYRLRIVKALEAGFDRIVMPYSPMVVIKSNDTHGFISFGYNEAGRTRCYIGGGNADKLNWSAALFHDNMSLLPKDDNTYALGDSSHRWSNVNAVNINASGNIVLSEQLLGKTPVGGTYPRIRFFSDASYYWMQIGSYDGLSAEGSMTICGIYGAGLKTLRLIASNTIIGGASQFVSLATFDAGIKIGDATLTWDATAGMLKIDKGIYSEGAITAKKKA